MHTEVNSTTTRSIIVISVPPPTQPQYYLDKKITYYLYTLSPSLFRFQPVDIETPVDALKSAGSNSSTCPSTSTATSVQTSGEEINPEVLSTQHKGAGASTLNDSVQNLDVAKTSKSNMMGIEILPPASVFGTMHYFKQDKSGATLLKPSWANNMMTGTRIMSNSRGFPPVPISGSPNYFSAQGHPGAPIFPFLPPTARLSEIK